MIFGWLRKHRVRLLPAVLRVLAPACAVGLALGCDKRGAGSEAGASPLLPVATSSSPDAALAASPGPSPSADAAGAGSRSSAALPSPSDGPLPTAQRDSGRRDGESVAARNTRLAAEAEAMNLRPLAAGPGLTSTPALPVAPVGITPLGGTVGGPTGAPRGEATIGSVTAPDTIPNAAATIAGARARIKFCYLRALQTDPSVKGKLLARVKVEPSGKVSLVDIALNTGLPEPVVACVKHALASRTFTPPPTQSGDVGVPINFVP